MNILFVCTGNTCRSPMAEGILKRIASEKKLDIKAVSAGIFAEVGNGANKNAIVSMRDMGIDIEDHKSQAITEDLIDESNLILTMTMGHKEMLVQKYPMKRYKIFLLNEYAFGEEIDIRDPYGGSKEEYDNSRDQIYKAVKKIYDYI